MFRSPKIQSRISRNVDPILRRSVQVHGKFFSLRFTKYSQCVMLILSSACWNNRDVRGSGYLWVWSKALSTGASCFKSTPQRSLAALPTFRQTSSLYNCLFCFQVGVFRQRPLINLLQVNFIHCCSLQPQQWISLPAIRGEDCLHTSSGPTATTLSLSSRLFLSFSQQRRLFSPHVIHTSWVSKFSIPQNLISSEGRRLALVPLWPQFLFNYCFGKWFPDLSFLFLSLSLSG